MPSSKTISTVPQIPTTEVLVFQTHPNVVASHVTFATLAKIRYCHAGRDDHPLAIKELFDDTFGLQEDFLLKDFIINEKVKRNYLNSSFKSCMVLVIVLKNQKSTKLCSRLVVHNCHLTPSDAL